MLNLRRTTVLIGATIALLQLAPGMALASPTSTNASSTAITTVVEDDILWFETEIGAEFEGKLRTKIFTPEGRNGIRRVWQICSFRNSGAGVYRCGIDIAEGSLAKTRKGTWVAKALVGSAPVAIHRFSI